MKLLHVPKEKFILRPQTRQHSEEYLRRLAASLLQKQQQAVGILPDFTVNFGNGRVLAARMEPKITHLWAVILDEEITEREFLRRQAVENFVKNDPSNSEKCQICVQYAASEPSMTLKEIAKDLGVDASMVTRWMAWEKCIDLVQQALSCDSITLATMYSISQLPKDQQEAALSVAVNGKPRKETVKKTRVNLQMPSGTVVTLAGDGLTVASIIEELAALLKEAKRAEEQGLDSKTFSAVMRDRSKAS